MCVCACVRTHKHEHMGKTPTGQPSSMKASLTALPTGIALYRVFSFSVCLSILAAILRSKCSYFTLQRRKAEDQKGN